jgi:hypothetical protein
MCFFVFCFCCLFVLFVCFLFLGDGFFIVEENKKFTKGSDLVFRV